MNGAFRLGAVAAALRAGGGGGGFDPNFANVSLLLHMEGANGSTTFTDSSSSPKTVVAQRTAQISTLQSRFGASSGRFFSGNLSIASNAAFGFGSGDFTVEMFVFLAAFRSEGRLIVFNAAANTALNLAYGNGGQRLTVVNEGVAHILTTTQALPINTWAHIAYARQANSLRLFFNGTQIGSTITTSIGSANGAPIIGDGGTGFDCYIDELRITKGVARYTANFTPPSAPFPDA